MFKLLSSEKRNTQNSENTYEVVEKNCCKDANDCDYENHLYEAHTVL